MHRFPSLRRYPYHWLSGLAALCVTALVGSDLVSGGDDLNKLGVADLRMMLDSACIKTDAEALGAVPEIIKTATDLVHLLAAEPAPVEHATRATQSDYLFSHDEKGDHLFFTCIRIVRGRFDTGGGSHARGKPLGGTELTHLGLVQQPTLLLDLVLRQASAPGLFELLPRRLVYYPAHTVREETGWPPAASQRFDLDVDVTLRVPGSPFSETIHWDFRAVAARTNRLAGGDYTGFEPLIGGHQWLTLPPVPASCAIKGCLPVVVEAAITERALPRDIVGRIADQIRAAWFAIGG